MTNNQEQGQDMTANAAPKKRRSWVGWIALIAVIIAIACWFQLVHQQKKSTNNYSQLQSSFHQTLSNTAQLGQAINDLQNQIASQNDQIQALQAAFNRLQASNSGYETDITLQQVDRYLQQANLSLTFNHDIAGAINLLQAADQRLNNVPDTQVIPLRQAIAVTIVKLQSIAPIDYVGVLSKLSALRDQVATLPLFAINSKVQIFHQNANEATPAITPAHGTLNKAWQTTVATLKTLVIIRNRHDEITPLISQTQEQFLRQNLQLILQQAQWAVLQNQQGVYQFSLTQANEWIQRYFADNEQATIAMQTDIAQLQKINLTPNIPDINLLISQLHTLQLQINKSRTVSSERTSPVVKIVPPSADTTPNSAETTPVPAPNLAPITPAPTSPNRPSKLVESKGGELV